MRTVFFTSRDPYRESLGRSSRRRTVSVAHIFRRSLRTHPRSVCGSRSNETRIECRWDETASTRRGRRKNETELQVEGRRLEGCEDLVGKSLQLRKRDGSGGKFQGVEHAGHARVSATLSLPLGGGEHAMPSIEQRHGPQRGPRGKGGSIYEVGPVDSRRRGNDGSGARDVSGDDMG